MTLATSQRARNVLPTAPRDPITRWLLSVAVLVVVLVVVGGFVRLSRAGLSIVDWDVVTGIIPPIGDGAWQASFAEYQQTPEYQFINQGMSLAEYQRIFYIEWAHRLIARVAGLMVIVPLLWFLWKGVLHWRSSLRYWMIAALFGAQGVMGWVMVSSGLRDRPVVSHFRLTIHLLVAMLLLGIVLWLALDRMEAARTNDRRPRPTDSGLSHLLVWALLGAVVVQISYGGLVAGLKAGYVSNTWPLMFGRIVPSGLLADNDRWWMALFDPMPSHWIHRWLAFVVAAVAVAVIVAIRRDRAGGKGLRIAGNWLLLTLGLQITLGVLVVIMGVPKWIALAHQGIGVGVFGISVVIVHRVHSTRPSDIPLLTTPST